MKSLRLTEGSPRRSHHIEQCAECAKILWLCECEPRNGIYTGARNGKTFTIVPNNCTDCGQTIRPRREHAWFYSESTRTRCVKCDPPRPLTLSPWLRSLIKR
jgi:hypothetical protein